MPGAVNSSRRSPRPVPAAEPGERVERLGHHRRRRGGQPPGHRQPVDRQVRVVRAAARPPRSASGPRSGPVQRSSRRWRTGRAGRGRRRTAPVEPAGDAQQHVRAHLVGLVHDRPRPAAVADGGPLGGGGDDDGAVGEVGRTCWPTVTLAVPADPAAAARSRCADSRPIAQLGCRCGQPVDQVVDLVVGLRDDISGSPAAASSRRGPHDQRRLAGAGRGVDDDAAVLAGRRAAPGPR